MKQKIIGDSSTDLNDKLREEFKIDIVPLVLNLGEERFIDDKGFDSVSFIEKMVGYEGIPKTACPSPQEFIEVYNGDEDVFVVTLSDKLSGTYNSAVLAKQIYHEENDNKSASVGQTLIALKIQEMINKEYESRKIVEEADRYLAELQTFFVAESLDNFIKNGRISKLSGFALKKLNVIPVMGSTPEGNIEYKTKGVGKKVYKKLIEIIVENSFDQENRILGIAHVNNLERAQKLKKEFEKKCNFKDIIIVETGGLSSIYCDNQGIIIAF